MRKLDEDDNWEIICDNLKKRWPKLTAEDLQLTEGKEQEFVELLSARTGESLEAVEKAIREAMITGDVC